MASIAEILAQGIALDSLGQLPQAEQLYLQVVKAEPSHVEALCLLGTLYQKLGKPAEAVTCLDQAARLKPNDPDASYRLGVVLAQQGNFDAAVPWLQQAWRLQPKSEDVSRNLRNALSAQADARGLAFAKLGKLAEAAAYYQRAIEEQPNYAAPHGNLGNILVKQGKLAAAAVCFRRVLELEPDSAVAHNGLGFVLSSQGEFEPAALHFRRALELKPDHAEAHRHLGAALAHEGKVDNALASFTRAVELNPDYAEAHVNRAIMLLLMGRFAEGWAEYEWRSRCAVVAEPNWPQPRWTGEPLDGSTIFLHHEQGLGDSLQFIRYAELVKQRGGTVVLGCPKSLRSLLAGCAGVDRVLDDEESPTDFDFHLSLLSLPAIFGTELETIPAKVPYLKPAADLVAQWKTELRTAELEQTESGSTPGFKVGIAWQGNPTQTDDRFRSIPLAQFADLARIPGVRIYSLQMGAGREQLGQLSEPLPIIDLGDRLGDFQNTAAIMQNMDLVITCDTAPAHLAGALGLPVWVALSFSPDWRWLLDRADSPWYPTMRLFRQNQRGNWNGVFQEITQELAHAAKPA